MKKMVIAGVCLATVLADTVLAPTIARAQNPIYGKGQGYADQMVLDRMYMRRMRAKYAKRRGTSSKTARAGQAKKRVVSTQKRSVAVASTPQKVASFSHPSVHIKRDSYQQFHLDDAKGTTVNFRFTPQSGKGKTVLKSYQYNFYDNMADFGGLAPGRYIVKAEAVYGGKKYPARIGSESGTPTNPTGGNFAPSIAIEIKPGVDSYGYKVLESAPSELQVRVIE